MKWKITLHAFLCVVASPVLPTPLRETEENCRAVLPHMTLLHRSISSLLRKMIKQDNLPLSYIIPNNGCPVSRQLDLFENLPSAIHRMEIFMLFLHEEEILKTNRGEVSHDFSSFISRYILPSIVNIKVLTAEILGEVTCCGHETIEFFRLRFTNRRSCILSHISSLQTYTHNIVHSC